MAILKHKGLSVSLEMYVNLIVHLSKLEAIMHGQQKAVRVLLLRYERITELYSAYASASDLESRQAYTLGTIKPLNITTFSLDNLINFWNVRRKFFN